MSDPALAVQNAIEAALRASADLKTAMGLPNARIYPVAPPDDQHFPFLTFGDAQIIGDETECSAGSEVFTDTHIWARIEDDVSGSIGQAKAIAAVVRVVIGRSLAISGFDLVECEFRDARHLIDSDRRTAHSIVTHRLLVEPL